MTNEETMLQTTKRNEIQCPRCGFNYMHRDSVELFEASEDADSAPHITISSGGEPSVDTDLSDNPSPRRDGMKIHFNCESCDPTGGVTSTLCIYQHKGNEIIEWENTI